MNSAFIFGLLIALMLTGMPISIALGLTVLTFLFVMTQVPIEAVALKLFTGIESFEIMAVPFFLLAGGFLPPRGVASGDDPFFPPPAWRPVLGGPSAPRRLLALRLPQLYTR